MKDRLKFLIDYLVMTQEIINKSDFCDKTGISNSYLSAMLAGKKGVSDNAAAKVVKSFPQINPIWLLSGDGAMLVTGDGPALTNNIFKGPIEGSNIGGHNNTIQQGNLDLEEKIRTLEATIADLWKALKSEQETNALLRSLIQNK